MPRGKSSSISDSSVGAVVVTLQGLFESTGKFELPYYLSDKPMVL
jgi:hypothetical protein